MNLQSPQSLEKLRTKISFLSLYSVTVLLLFLSVNAPKSLSLVLSLSVVLLSVCVHKILSSTLFFPTDSHSVLVSHSQYYSIASTCLISKYLNPHPPLQIFISEYSENIPIFSSLQKCIYLCAPSLPDFKDLHSLSLRYFSRFFPCIIPFCHFHAFSQISLSL